MKFSNVFLYGLVIAGFSLQSFASNERCESIKSLETNDIAVTNTEIVPASGDLPEYCRVTGSIKTEIGYEIRLPTQNWNRKFYMAGCGAFCGAVAADTPKQINSINYGLKRNYAVSTMDGGHTAESKVNGKWAHNHREREENWGHLAVTKTAKFTKKAINQFYGKTERHSYFSGCSTGGRMAAMEAMRYPDDFDGVISAAPALNYTSLVATYFAWIMQYNHDEQDNEYINQADAEILAKRVYEKCDAVDGVTDGLITHPPACQFDFNDLLCDEGSTSECFNSDQVNALEKLYSTPVNSQGEQLFAGHVPLSSEPYWKIWFTSKTEAQKKAFAQKPTHKKKGLISTLNEQFLRYMAFEHDPEYEFSSSDFDFDTHAPKLDFMGQIYNSDGVDLQRFKNNGGKMILWHGWSDVIIPPQMTIDYYDRMTKKFGGLEKTQDFSRLFLFPGVGHCGLFDGPGPTQEGFDVLTLLENWVENNNAPNTIKLTKTNKDGSTEWTRPACVYPLVTTYNGSGDPSLPESFSCKAAPH